MRSAGSFGDKPDWRCKLGLHRYVPTWTIGMSRCLRCSKWKDRDR